MLLDNVFQRNYPVCMPVSSYLSCKSSLFSMPFMEEKIQGGTSAYPCPNEFKGNGGHMLVVRLKCLPSLGLILGSEIH